MAVKLAVVSVWAKDVPSTAHFYRDVIGLDVLPHHGDRPHFDLAGTYLVILEGEPVPARNSSPSRFPILAFAVDDLDKAIDRLHVHNIELPWGIEEDEGSRWVMFYDPAGNLIEYAEFREP